MNAIEMTTALVRPCLVFAMVVALMALLIWMERKGAAYIQDRRGPNRARLMGMRMGGIFHVVADAIKLLTKEEVMPAAAARPLALVAPMIAFAVTMAAVAVVPFTGSVEIAGHHVSLQVSNMGAGLVYAIAVSSLGVYAVVLAGWASGSTYSFLGAMRAAAQLISYELALGMSAVAVFLVAGSLSLVDIVADQAGPVWMWNALRQPLAFLVFLTALFAEAARLPFDLPEGEAEIVGYHVEYSSMRFAMFFMAEYAHIVVGSAIVAALFFGGWQLPFVSDAALARFAGEVGRAAPPWVSGAATALVQLAVMLAKTLSVAAGFIWVRWTLPRFRYDQLMAFGWKVLLPLAMINLAITAFAVMRLGV